MKTARKAIMAVLCVLCIIVATITGTLAYLTDKDEVTNTFTVGKVKMTMDEADVTVYGEQEKVQETDENGNLVVDDKNEPVMVDAPRVDANEYKLIPGHTYKKDPVIHIEEGSESCYVFIKVQNDIAQIEDSTNTIAEQITNTNGWTILDATNNPDVYWKLWAMENTDRDLETFATFKIKSDIDNDEIDDYVTAKDDEGNPTVDATLIKVTAYAIQKDGMTDAASAWTALQTQLNPPAGTP